MAAEVTIRIRDNGPLLIEGTVQLVDAEGNAFPRDPDKPVFLCRCGETRNGPFCDGSHKACGFQSSVRAGV